MKTRGVEAELKILEQAGKVGVPVAKFALYEGARVVADRIKAAAGGLPYKPETVAQIQNAVGVAKFKDTLDGTGTSISFDGYFAESHFPIPYFVREIERGTALIRKRPFLKKAVSKCEAEAKAAMDAAGTAKLEELTSKTGG